jgi:hypothetical protein
VGLAVREIPGSDNRRPRETPLLLRTNLETRKIARRERGIVVHDGIDGKEVKAVKVRPNDGRRGLEQYPSGQDHRLAIQVDSARQHQSTGYIDAVQPRSRSEYLPKSGPSVELGFEFPVPVR